MAVENENLRDFGERAKGALAITVCVLGGMGLGGAYGAVVDAAMAPVSPDDLRLETDESADPGLALPTSVGAVIGTVTGTALGMSYRAGALENRSLIRRIRRCYDRTFGEDGPFIGR